MGPKEAGKAGISFEAFWRISAVLDFWADFRARKSLTISSIRLGGFARVVRARGHRKAENRAKLIPLACGGLTMGASFPALRGRGLETVSDMGEGAVPASPRVRAALSQTIGTEACPCNGPSAPRAWPVAAPRHNDRAG